MCEELDSFAPFLLVNVNQKTRRVLRAVDSIFIVALTGKMNRCSMRIYC